MKINALRLFLILSFLISLSSAPGLAQSGDDPVDQPPAPGLDRRSEPALPSLTNSPPALSRLPPSMSMRNAGALYSSVITGQPGLSYRHVQTFGQSEVGYQTDSYHLNAPGGMFIDGGNNLYLLEDHGYRLLRYNSSAANTLSLGIPGLCVEGNSPTRFCAPRDAATDGSGNIWLATGHRVVKFDPNGNYLTQLPTPTMGGSWSSGASTTQFNNASGVAVDETNDRLYVADRDNHRVQVYTIASGSPVYLTTIGMTGIPGGGATYLNKPTRLAVNSAGQLYVADTGNARIQRCTIAGAIWNCTTFTSGGMTPAGLALDSAGRPHIYDSLNRRVIFCTTLGACSDLITGLGYAQDLAVDSLGNIFLGDYERGVVRQYDAAGNLLDAEYLGATSQSYFPTGDYVFSPWGAAVAADGSLYAGENFGQRLLKFNAAGQRQWQVGDPGGVGSQVDQFNTPQGKPALAANGDIYFPDSKNARIQIYDSAGNYLSTFGSFGTGTSQFKFPAGIAISPVDGDIYVADRDNQRVLVYNSSWQHEATLGFTGLAGTLPTFFNWPSDVAVDDSNNIFVADYKNYRVQKCTRSGSTYNCTTFAGVTGTIADGYFDYLQPVGVALDSAGRVLVVDEWNNRIQVFDATGAYLTTIGGSWGARSGQFRQAVSLATDEDANVYVSDFYNNRIQKYSPGVPGWRQSNINAFGDMNNWNLNSLAEFNTQLYAGTYSGSGAQLWRMDAAGNWTQLVPDGFGDLYTEAIASLATFNASLYAGVYNASFGAAILRSPDGEPDTWEVVVSDGRDNPDNTWVDSLEVFNGQIYAGVGNFYDGAQIWRSSSGNLNSWSAVVTGGLQSPDNLMFRSSAVHGGYLYFGTENSDIDTFDSTTGGIVIRSLTGNAGSWTNVNGNGFGDANNYIISGLESFGSYLYASTGRWNNSGVQVWRCQTCVNLASWEKVVDNGFSNPDNRGWSTLQEYNGQLYLLIGNSAGGMQVWRSSTGNSGEWTQLNGNGFGDSENAYPYMNNATVFNSDLFIGVENQAHGPEIWQLADDRIYLPLLIRE